MTLNQAKELTRGTIAGMEKVLVGMYVQRDLLITDYHLNCKGRKGFAVQIKNFKIDLHAINKKIITLQDMIDALNMVLEKSTPQKKSFKKK